MSAEQPGTIAAARWTRPSRRISARTSTILGAGVGAGLAAFEGLYPQFDHGTLRIPIAFTSFALASFAIWLALKVRSRFGAVGVVLVTSAVLGAANTIIPAFILWGKSSGSELFTLFFFGLMFGVPIGIAYGLPLAILTVLTHRPVYGTSLDAADRAKTRTGFWVIAVTTVALALGRECAPSPAAVPTEVTTIVVLGLVATIGVTLMVIVRRALRARWEDRIRSGGDPSYRTRELTAYDPPELPRLGDGATVIEWSPVRFDGVAASGSSNAPSEGIYRSSALGIPLAIIADR